MRWLSLALVLSGLSLATVASGQELDGAQLAAALAAERSTAPAAALIGRELCVDCAPSAPPVPLPTLVAEMTLSPKISGSTAQWGEDGLARLRLSLDYSVSREVATEFGRRWLAAVGRPERNVPTERLCLLEAGRGTLSQSAISEAALRSVLEAFAVSAPELRPTVRMELRHGELSVGLTAAELARDLGLQADATADLERWLGAARRVELSLDPAPPPDRFAARTVGVDGATTLVFEAAGATGRPTKAPAVPSRLVLRTPGRAPLGFPLPATEDRPMWWTLARLRALEGQPVRLVRAGTGLEASSDKAVSRLEPWRPTVARRLTGKVEWLVVVSGPEDQYVGHTRFATEIEVVALRPEQHPACDVELGLQLVGPTELRLDGVPAALLAQATRVELLPARGRRLVRRFVEPSVCEGASDAELAPLGAPPPGKAPARPRQKRRAPLRGG